MKNQTYIDVSYVLATLGKIQDPNLIMVVDTRLAKNLQ
jgi:hypothetical protein